MDPIKLEIERNTYVYVDIIPNECPNCHKIIEPNLIIYNFGSSWLELIYKCTSNQCSKSFIATYNGYSGEIYKFLSCNIGELKKSNFSEVVQLISSAFIKIFNESYFAEQHNLTEICGVGYRKALEFLIKDYLIKINHEKEEDIKKKLLSNCIKEYVSDINIKKVAERAVWLGNDETHYIRRWEDQSLSDLKKLIFLTVHWIEMEELTKSFEEEMPAKK
jgi:hypothetical protein